MEKELQKETEQKVVDYVMKHYKKTFEKVTPIVIERENHFRIFKHKDGSPLILGKGILNN